MAIAFEIIYDAFRDKAIEYDLYELSEETSENILRGWLKGAISKFSACKKLSDRDEELKQFNSDLTDTEIDILAQCMVYTSLKPKLNNSDLFKNSLSTKDYTTFSPSKLLESISTVYENCNKETNSMINKYTFDNNDVRDWKRE